jgi:hypothetical protein
MKVIQLEINDNLELNKVWSSRSILYEDLIRDKLEIAETATAGSIAMLSEFGWLFLINDRANYLRYLFGKTIWSQIILERAKSIFLERYIGLLAHNIQYFKYVIPEKSSIYNEYLPKMFTELEICDERPASMLCNKGLKFYHYLHATLVDAKSYGLLYFRGDSHANWLGSYFIYNYIINEMNMSVETFKTTPPIQLRTLTASLVGYGGDLYDQMNGDQKIFLSPQGALGGLGLDGKIEHLVSYVLPESVKNSRRIECDEIYSSRDNERRTYVYENSDENLPRAVIFRDSTSQFILDLIAEHFSYCIFIWHKGSCYQDIIDREKPDVVLHIMAERFLVQYEHNAAFANYF